MSTHTNERAAWRASVVEDVLFPEQRICDPHHHLWGHPGDVYYAPELAADINDGHNVLKTIYVEAGSAYDNDRPLAFAPVGETEFVAEQADTIERLCDRPIIAGIIAFANLSLGDELSDVLDAHEAATGGRFVGIRHSSAWVADDGIVNHEAAGDGKLMRQAAFINGVRMLGKRGLTYDAWLYHPQLPDIVSLAEAAPETTIVLDHLGAPLGIGPYAGRREEVLSFCREQLKVLAQAPNVRLKLGGIGMPLIGNGWHRLSAPPSSETMANDWSDHIRWCIDTFGPQRTMFESNFPPDGRSCSYRTLWNVYKRIAAPYSDEERNALFHDTALTVYGLDD